jgi:hypothetical protein
MKKTEVLANLLKQDNIELASDVAEALCGGFGMKPGTRVRVHSGDGQTRLGDGKYVGEATVWYIRTADGNLLSHGNAEEKPPSHMVPEGGSLVESEGNPKIVLDSGKVVYGCQVWWEVIKE